MTLAEQFKQHLDNNKLDTIEFFLSLSKEEQLSLKPFIEELVTQKPHNYLYDGYYFGKITTNELEPSAQLQICACYIYNYKDFTKYFGSLSGGYYACEYYKIYRPKWLAKDIKEHFIQNKYVHCLALIEYGLTFTDSDIVNSMVHSIRYWNPNIKEDVFDTSHFDKYPIALQQHFWLIFYQPSEIHFLDRYITEKDGKERNWIRLINDWIKEGKIDRQRVLKECLLTTTRNFNKVATGWFYDLFESLEPTEDELIQLLPELMLVLNGKHSKPINKVLQQFKTLCLQQEFNLDEFLAISEILLTSEVKAVINNTFAVFEKIAKANTKEKNQRHAQLCQLACNALIHNDEKIQTKVAKFLIKYGNVDDEELLANITCYYESLFSSVQQLLVEHFTELAIEPIEEETFEFLTINHLADIHKIELPQSFDDQIFFITQAFENNEVYHFDMYLEVIKRLIPQINQENIASLAPAMKGAERAINLSSNKYGVIEQLMAIQFINLLDKLIGQYPCKEIGKIIDKINAKEIYGHHTKNVYGDSYTLPLEDMPLHQHKGERIFSQLLCHSKQLVEQNSTKPSLSMLSTPTHRPCFIDLEVFCQRLHAYQQHNVAVNITDFQIAVSRLVIKQPLTHNLTGEYADIIYYLTDKTALDFVKCKTLALWASVIYHKQLDFSAFIEHFQLTELSVLIEPLTWQITTKHYKDGTTNYRLTKLETRHTKSYQQQVIEREQEKVNTALFYLTDVPDLWLIFHTDYAKLLTMTPFNPDLAILAHFINQVNYGGAYSVEVDAIYTVNQTIPILMETWQRDYAESCYLFLACVLLLGKKSCTQMGGELWLKAVSEQNMDNQRLGTILGKLENDEFAPLKRFTDLINSHLINISNVHNKELIILISNMIANMNDTPIKGTKKLLELYLELLTVTQTELPALVMDKLAIWAEVKSLKPIINKLNKINKESF